MREPTRTTPSVIRQYGEENRVDLDFASTFGDFPRTEEGCDKVEGLVPTSGLALGGLLYGRGFAGTLLDE